MTTGDNEQKKKEGKGFAGLSSLVSNVDTSPPPAVKKETTGVSSAASSTTGHPVSRAAQPQPSQRQPYQAPLRPSSGSSSGKWVLVGIAVVIGWFWLAGENKKPSSSPRAYTPSVQAPSHPEESKPPVGQNLTFSMAQIRYCLSEDIRIDGAKSAVNSYSSSDVDRFNEMVADYNSRCGSFRYRRGALESARRDIEPYRSQLSSEGRQRFIRYQP